MKLKKVLMASILVTGLLFSGNWEADTTNARINFTVEGIFGTVHGSFTGLQATIQFDEKDLASASISASVEAKTVSTGISLRNSDLRNKEEWFNIDKYPRISFKSKKFEKTSTGYKVLGDLTIKNVTKSMEIPFSFTSDGKTGLFKGEFKIKRMDYSLGKEGGSVGSVVNVTLNIPVTSH